MLCPGFIYALDMPKLCERNEIYQVEGLTGERGKERAEKRERERESALRRWTPNFPTTRDF